MHVHPDGLRDAPVMGSGRHVVFTTALVAARRSRRGTGVLGQEAGFGCRPKTSTYLLHKKQRADTQRERKRGLCRVEHRQAGCDQASEGGLPNGRRDAFLKITPYLHYFEAR